MAEEKKESKTTLEREYIVPLRMGWLKVPKFKRANKAVKTLKEFIAQHMKIYDRDLRKVKVDVYLNNELRFRGMRKPPAKIKVKAIKYEDGTVAVKLVDFPKHIEFELARNARREAEIIKKEAETEKPEKKEAKPEEKTEEQAKDEKEKEESSKIAEEAIEKTKAKEMKHTTGAKKAPEIKRKVLNR
jgi:large subunit ribosomal protein L31e